MPVDSSLDVRSAYLDGERLATLAPTSPAFAYEGRTIAPDRRYVLSRFAYVHRGSTEMILESPRAHARINLRGGGVHSCTPWRSRSGPGSLPA